MKRFFGKKRKKTPKPPQQPVAPGRSSDVAVGSPGFRAEQDAGINDNGSTGASSRITVQGGAPGFRVSNVGIDGARSRREFADETSDNGLQENETAGLSRITKRANEGPALGMTSGNANKGERERFGPLKIALGAIPAAYVNDEGAIAVGNKVEDLLSRVVELEEHLDSRPSDIAEQRRRDELRRDFERIERQLQSLAEMSELPTGHVPGLLEDLRETIFHYQTAKQKQLYDQRLHEMDPAEATALNSFRSAQGAEYRHGSRIGCLKGTRSAVLDEIEFWTKDFDKPPVYWLNGLAGTGKTTIAQTIAERTFADGKLGASFFCSRDFEDRSNLYFIFPTIAVQLARKYPDFRLLLVPLVRSDPGITHESLYNQLHALVVKPLKESAISTVIIIDALDECKDEEPASAILSVLGQFVSEIPKVKFLITGRPEPRIREGFRLPLLADAADVFVLHDVKPTQVDSDIRLFFRTKFSELARRRPGLDGWPTEEQLHTLCERAAGLFVYASATVKFIDKQSVNPRKQLDLLLQSPESSVREAKTKFKENTTLNSLYASILLGAFGDDDDSDNDPTVRSVLGAMVLASNPLSPSAIALLLGLDTEDVFPLLSSAQSLLILQEDIHYPVRPFHKSFPDFITDPDRCTNQRFHVSPPGHHSQLLIGSLNLMDRMLEKNMCKLPDLVANSDVGDLEERIERYIDPALQYACRSWHKHLIAGPSTSTSTSETTSALHRFMQKKLLFWLEVLSVLGDARIAVDALQAAVDWLEELPTLDLASDCFRFVSGRFEIINTSSPHIYHSALASTPRTSMIWKLYGSHARPFTRVLHGVPSSWDSTATAATRPFAIGLAAWSLSARFIAVAKISAMAVDILDSATLQRLQSLGVSREGIEYPRALVFSPDGRMFSCASSRFYGFVSTWDLQTGGLSSTVQLPPRDEVDGPKGDFYITYSIDGKMVGVLRRDSVIATISIVDVVSGVHTHDVYPDTPWTYDIWTHGESLRFATAKGAVITIWEVGFTQGATPLEIETLSVPDDADQAAAFDQEKEQDVRRTQFFPIPRRLVFTRVSPTPTDDLLVWGAQNPVSVLHEGSAPWRLKMSFSSDGRFFACSTTGLEVHLWKEFSTGYKLVGKLPCKSRRSSSLLSPNGESIITYICHTIQLWHTKGFTTPSIAPTQVPDSCENFILEFVPDRRLAVVVRPGEKIATVLDLKSSLPQLTIDTSMKVSGLRVIKNDVVVIGDRKTITWNLPEGDRPPHSRVGVENSTQITFFSDEWQCDATIASISLDLRYIALLRRNSRPTHTQHLHIYCPSTGRHSSHVDPLGASLWFDSDGSSLWCASMNQADWWNIAESNPFPIRRKNDIASLSPECPWTPSSGYEVTVDGWLIGPGGKKLFLLPPPWRSYAAQRVWSGQFLALLHGALPQPVILDLAP